jgi:hypothetical protein
MIDLGSFLACHKSKLFLAMRGTTALFNHPPPPKQKGAHPPSGNPLMDLLVGSRAEKVVTFLNNISRPKTSVVGLNKVFLHHLRQQKGGEKVVKRRVHRVMG